MELSASLPPISEAQMKYAVKNLPKFSYKFGRKEYCSECGGIVDNGVCTKCGEKKLSDYGTRAKNRMVQKGYYYGILTVKDDVQVIRHFIVTKTAVVGEGSTYSFDEVVQNWIERTGKITHVARKRGCNIYKEWALDSEMNVRHSYGGYDCYTIFDYLYYPKRPVTFELKRAGFKWSFHDIEPSHLFVLLLSSTLAETLFKTGREKYLIHHGRLSDKSAELAICHRHKYSINDVSLWIDVVEMCRRLGEDTHNPKNICPDNLAGFHDSLQRRIDAKTAREERLRRKSDLANLISRIDSLEEAYKNEKGKYFSISITGNGINVSVLDSVRAFYDEYMEFGHCVFSHEYYKEEDSLILSARDEAGHRIETVEYDLVSNKVLQSRGLHNCSTDRHEEIVSLVERELPKCLKRLGS